jgi:sulfur-oxidizing protein SoxZ
MTGTLDGAPRVRIPASAEAGEVIEIRTLLEHPMRTGLHTDEDGAPIQRDILARFVAEADGEPFFTVAFGNSASANPGLVFQARVDATTAFTFTWLHEDGRSVSARARVVVG